jgi:hypothetical protein
MTTYKVTIKEVNNDHVLHTSITTDQDLDYVRSFFGLEEHDVDWYTIEKEE